MNELGFDREVLAAQTRTAGNKYRNNNSRQPIGMYVMHEEDFR